MKEITNESYAYFPQPNEGCHHGEIVENHTEQCIDQIPLTYSL